MHPKDELDLLYEQLGSLLDSDDRIISLNECRGIIMIKTTVL